MQENAASGLFYRSYPCQKCRKVVGTVPTSLGTLCSGCAETFADSVAELDAQILANKRRYYRALSELGEKFADRTFANFRVTEQNRAAFEAARTAFDEHKGAYIFGGPGNGKTHLAAAVVNASVSAEREAIFTTGVGLLQRIRATYGRRSTEDERDIIDKFAAVPLLVLDDLGTENFTPDTGRLFYSLVNKRYEYRVRPLIVTSNLSLADLQLQWARSGVEEHVASKICDRISELCSNTIVRITSGSVRGTL